MAPRHWPLVGLAALSVVWGTQFLVIRTGQATLPPLLTAALRFALVAAVGQVALWFGRTRPPPGLGSVRLAFAAAQAVSMALLYGSQRHLPSAVAGVLFTTTPLFVAVVAARVVPGERVGVRTAGALACGFTGAAILTLGAGSPTGAAATVHIAAGAAALGAAVAGAVNKLLAKRLTTRVPAAVLLRDLGVVVAAANALGWLVAERDEPLRFTAAAVAAFVYLGLVASAAASALYLVLLRRYAVTAMSYLQFVTALIAVLTGALVGGEPLGVASVAGVAGILAGLWLLAAAGRARAA